MIVQRDVEEVRDTRFEGFGDERPSAGVTRPDWPPLS